MSASDIVCKFLGTAMKPDFIKAAILIASLIGTWSQYSGKVEAQEQVTQTQKQVANVAEYNNVQCQDVRDRPWN